jgi:type II secretory pathway pseudopilin PulG
VVAIIGILASVVLSSLSNARSQARDAVRKSDLRNLQTAYEMYLNDGNGSSSVPASEFACGSAATRLISVLINGGYLSSRINDPLADVNACGTALSGSGSTGEYADYMFNNSASGAYCIHANLENDPATPCDTGGFCGLYGMDYSVCG